MTTVDLRDTDRLARITAQSVFDRPLVLEAGAGTGKTSTLVARLTSWCLGPGWSKSEARLSSSAVAPSHDRIAALVLDRIVAITFTEAAAAEMASRVGDALAAIERGEIPSGLAVEHLPSDSITRRERAHALVSTLDHLIVRTIHAYCRRLLATYPLAARVHPSFQVDADRRLQAQVVREVIDATLQTAYTNPEHADWVVLADYGLGPLDIEEAVADLLDGGVVPESLEDDPFNEDRLATLVIRLHEAVDSFLSAEADRLRRVSKGSTSKETIDSLHRTGSTLPGPQALRQDYFRWLADLQTVWSDASRARLAAWAEGDFNKSESKAVGDSLGELSELAARLFGRIGPLLDLDPRLLESGRRVVAPLLRQVDDKLRNRGIMTFSALLREARDLLRVNPDVTRRIRQGIDLLMVDEFQDTDAIQCDVVRLLAIEGDPRDRPALFVVGDPKQSIYGWRNADLQAYDNFVGEICRNGGERHHLSVNFRSVPAILEEVERVVKPVMHEEVGVQPRFQALQASDERTNDPGFSHAGFAPIEHWVSWSRDQGGDLPTGDATELEARALATNLVEMNTRHGVAWKDVGILMRSTGDLDIYCHALREAGVPYAVERDRSYYRRREVIDASSLVQCLLDPSDHLALLGVLRSPLVGVPDAALLPLWKGELPARLTELHGADPEPLARIDEIVRAAAAKTPSVPGIERLAGWEHLLMAAARHIGVLRESFRTDPSDVFVEKLRHLFLIEPTEAARYLGRYRLANLERFFAQLLAALETSGGDTYSVLRNLRQNVSDQVDESEGRPREAAEDAVRIMTIHAAKGLAFTHVYLVQLHKHSKPRGNGKSNDAGEVDGRLEYRLFGAPTPRYSDVLRGRARVEAAEVVRTLYVAMTRARDRLVMLGKWPTRPVAREETHIALLHERRLSAADLDDIFAQLRLDPGSTQHHADGALWVFPGLRDEGSSLTASSKPEADGSSASSQRAHSDGLALHQLRPVADRRRQRVLGGAVSEEAHKELREALAARVQGDENSPSENEIGESVARRIARLAGTTVHRCLERFDLTAEPTNEFSARLERLDEMIPPTTRDDDRAQVLTRATEILAAFRQGPLWIRFVELREQVVARELPVLLPAPSDDGPVAYLAGAIDLVGHDPTTNEWWVVDYKSDVLATLQEIEQRARHYESQGVLYARALQEGLGLPTPPRVEFWFLQAGAVR